MWASVTSLHIVRQSKKAPNLNEKKISIYRSYLQLLEVFFVLRHILVLRFQELTHWISFIPFFSCFFMQTSYANFVPFLLQFMQVSTYVQSTKTDAIFDLSPVSAVDLWCHSLTLSSLAHLHCNILGGKNYRAKKARLAKNKSRVFLFGFHHRPYPNFVSYNLQVISFKKEHKRYGIGKLFHLVSDNEQEKTMLAKVDQVLSQPTSQPYHLQPLTVKSFCPLRQSFTLVSLKMKMLLLAILLTIYFHPKDHRLQGRNMSNILR